MPELNNEHCRGRWTRISQLHEFGDATRFAVLTRLRWLAPARLSDEATLSLQQISDHLQAQFAVDARPVLVVSLAPYGEEWIEQDRIFVVPDPWNLPSASANPAQ